MSKTVFLLPNYYDSISNLQENSIRAALVEALENREDTWISELFDALGTIKKVRLGSPVRFKTALLSGLLRTVSLTLICLLNTCLWLLLQSPSLVVLVKM